jgi:hypothetical protein
MPFLDGLGTLLGLPVIQLYADYISKIAINTALRLNCFSVLS